MRNLHIHLLLTFVLLGALSCNVSFVFAQEADSTIFMVIDYMKVQPEMENLYKKMEKEVWGAVHQKRKDEHNLTDWQFYKVLIPFGDETEYNYMTVNIYTGYKMLAGHYDDWGVNFEEILDEEQMNLFDQTNKTRKLVRQAVLRFHDGVWSDYFRKSPPRYLAINYMNVKEGYTFSDYLKMENDIWKPLHKGRIDAGIMKGWGLYTLELPLGTNIPYQATTIDSYQKFEDINSPYFEELFPKVHAGKDEVKMMERTEKTREILNSDIVEVLARLK